MTSSERGLLYNTCITGQELSKEIEPIAHRVLSFPDWRSSTLGALLSTTANRKRSNNKIEDANAIIFKRLVKEQALESLRECTSLRGKFREYINALEKGLPTSPPVASHDIKINARCLGISPAISDKAHFFTFRTDGLAEVFVGYTTTDALDLQKYGVEDFIAFDGHKFLVVAIPSGASVAVRGRRINQSVPLGWNAVATHDQTVWDVPGKFSCIALSAQTESNSIVLIDGSPVDAGPITNNKIIRVSPEPHEITVLNCLNSNDDTSCAVRYREIIDLSNAPGSICKDVRLDLKTRNTVSVVGARASRKCDETALWSSDIREAARDYLRQNETRIGKTFKDIEAYAFFSTTLAKLQSQISRSEQSLSSIPTGADGVELLSRAANEAWRQGVDWLLILNLRCNPPTKTSAWRYYVSVQAVSLHDVFRRTVDDVGGMDLNEYIVEEVIEFIEPSNVRSAVGEAIDRIFKVPYIRIIRTPQSIHYRTPARFKIVAYDPGALHRTESPRPPVVKAFRNTDRDSCDEPSSSMHRALKSKGRSEARIEIFYDMERRAIEKGDRTTRAYDVNLTPNRPGSYTVEVFGRQRASDRDCFTFSMPRSDIWGRIAISGGPFYKTSIVSGANVVMTHAQVGRTWYQRHWLGYGISGGYELVSHSIPKGLPTWDDIPSGRENVDQNVMWMRHAAVVGPHVEGRGRWSKSPFDLRGRLSAYLNLGYVDPSKIPEEHGFVLGLYRVDRGVVDVNVDVYADLGAAFAVSETMTVGIWVLLGIRDLFRGSSVPPLTDNRAFLTGLAISLEGGQ